MDLHEIDKKISGFVAEMNFYVFLIPLNGEEEKEKFFAALLKGKEYNPVFRYSPPEVGNLKKRVKAARSCLAADGIQYLFAEKLDFMLKQIELLQSDDGDFGRLSGELYGVPDAECLKVSEKILVESLENGFIFPEETVTPDEMAAVLRGELKSKGIDWKCVLKKRSVSKINVSGRDKTIYVNPDICYTADEVGRLKVHEVMVHVYRGANGRRQPFGIFAEGLAGYDETEEGLAIAAEEVAGCLKTDTRQLKIYAARAVCVDYCARGTFYETFTRLGSFFPDYLAYRLTERGKRGLKDTSVAGAFTNGFHYIEGWMKVKKYIADGGDLSLLYTGKIGIKDAKLVKKLLDEGILERPRYLPDFVSGK